jgi:hypothetical protein
VILRAPEGVFIEFTKLLNVLFVTNILLIRCNERVTCPGVIGGRASLVDGKIDDAELEVVPEEAVMGLVEEDLVVDKILLVEVQGQSSRDANENDK